MQIGGEVKDLDVSCYVPPARSRKMPRAAKFAVVAAWMALEDSGLEITEENRHEIDLFLGVACPDIHTFTRVIERRVRRGRDYVDPTVVATAVTTAPTGYVSVELGLAGETPTFSTGCSSATNAIGHAFRKIRSGAGKIAFAGGADAGVQQELVAAYAKANALSTRNGDPQSACRPFEANRDGHVLSEAAGVLVLEEHEHARARDARIYAEVVGYGASSDCHSMLEVSGDERNSSRCIDKTLRDAGLATDAVDYFCAHGSAARDTDVRETRMLKRSLGEHAYRTQVSSIKSMTGHPFGASGGLQAAACALAIQRGAIPPTINYDEPDPECDLDYVPNEARETKARTALAYSLGMGGNNAALAFTAC